MLSDLDYLRGLSLKLFKLKVSNTQKTDKALQMICYCSDFQKSLISLIIDVLIDGTFDIKPPGFEQVLVIMGRTVHMNIPNSIFMTLKNEHINMFTLSTKTVFRERTYYITNFELSEINSFKKCFLQHGDTLQL